MAGRILITGANGYLGGSCVERLSHSPELEVVAVWHARNDRMLARPSSNVFYEQCDLTDPQSVEALFAKWKIDTVLHAAALLADDQPSWTSRAVLSNICATANLVDSALRHGCTRLLYCSSISVYGDVPCPEGGWEEGGEVLPSSIYGWTKYAGEQCLRLHSGAGRLTCVSVRLAGIHGRGRRGGVIFQMMRAALADEPLIVNNPNNRFQLVFIDDAVDALLLTLYTSLPDSYNCINLGSHVFPSIREMAKLIIEECGSKSNIRVGENGGGGDQVMNTLSMAKTLGISSDGIESHLQQIRVMIEGAKNAAVGERS